jgi:pSer/pThr/pTyr-binding forkhead associated (FHA) protein
VPLEQPTAPRSTAQPKQQAETRKIETAATVPSLEAVRSPASGEPASADEGDDLLSALGPPPELPRNQSTAVIRIDQVEGSSGRRAVDEVELSEAPRLVVLNTDFAGRDFPLTRTEMRVGRTDDNDVSIDHRSLSRTHCKLVREDSGEWRVIDMQSANGLMVNGEPYAQVTLRPGDVLELGHVKMKFVGPDDEVSLPTTTDLPMAPEEGERASKAPLIALVLAALVIVLGGGGYALWKSQNVVAPPPSHRPDPSPGTARPDPASARAEVEGKLSEARAAIAALDWNKAELLLNSCKLDGALHPEARALLTQMDAEKGFKVALEQAAAALEAGKLEDAKTQLDSAMETKLLQERYESLEAVRAEAVKEKLSQGKKFPKGKEPPKVEPIKAPAEAQNLLEEARKLRREGSLDAAIIRLERCVRVFPKFAPCFRNLGSYYASRGERDGAADDYDKARENYQKFLEVAPPDDEYVPKVRNILKGQAQGPDETK